MSTSAERTYRGRPVADRRIERRNRFIDAGLTVFAGTGYANSSITDVCGAAGLSRRQFYEEFGSREDLLVAVYDRIQDDASAAVQASTPAIVRGDFHRSATVVLTAYVESFATDPRRAKVSFVETVGVSDRVELHRRERRTAWTEIFELAIRTGVGSESVPVGGYPMAAAAFIGAVNGLVYEWILADPRPSIAELVEVMVAIVVALGAGS